MATFQIDFFSKSLNRAVPLTACLPVDRKDDPNAIIKPFKSLYLLNGYTESNFAWQNITNIPQLAQKYNIAIFMPAGENSFYLDDVTRMAYYGRYIGEELVSFTREVFKLSDKKEDTILGGLSMGGYGSARNGLKYSETFGAIISLSSAFIIDNLTKITPEQNDSSFSYEFFAHTFGTPSELLGSDVDPKFLAKNLLDNGAKLPKFYIACGTEDFLLDENRDYVDYLKKIDFPHTYVEGPGAHEHSYWDEYIKKALDWYFE